MYCGQCGKKVMDNMLFCPFCGSPIVIPDQDEALPEAAPQSLDAAPQPADPAPQPVDAAPQEDAPVAAEAREMELPEAGVPENEVTIVDVPEPPAQQEKRNVGLFDADMPGPEDEIQDAPEDVFEPLRFDFEEMAQEEEAAEELPPDVEAPPAEDPLELIPEEKPAQRRDPARTRRPEPARRRSVNTYIPIKDVDPDDIFMDEDDDYDAEADELDDDEDYYYEEREEGSFLRRHIRGIVGILLLLILITICLLWAVTDRGQLTLAQFNFAWRADAYAELGYEAYQQNNDLVAARYYEKAYAREEGNYDYAHSAMVAYYEAGETELSAEMLKKCIEMRPDSAEPYKELLILYPDAQSRPWAIKELVRQGYERTGNEALRQD